MANSYENEVNELVDGIMKVAEETAAASGMEKEAGIFNRKKKSEVAANKAKADAMFSGQGGDDSASDPRGKVQKKWKRIKAKFFKKANDNTEEMIEKIAAAAGTEVDMLLDYIEKIAAEEDLDGQDIVDTLYEEIEEEPEVEEEDAYEDDEEDAYDDEEDEDDEDEEDEEYGEEVEASMINDAMEKIAAVTGMDEETIADYIVAVAAENEVDELEVLAAMEDEADAELEKEAGMKPGFARNVRDTVTKGKLNAELFGATHKKGLKIGGGVAAAAGLAGAGYAGYKHVQKKKSQAEAEKQAFEALVDEAIEKVAFAAGVSGEDVVDYVEKVAAENDLDEIEILAELEKEAGMKPGFARNVRDTVTKGKLNAELFGATHKKGLKIGGGVAAAAGLAGAGYAGYKHVQKKKSQAEAEKEAFEVMVDEAIEKVAFVAGVSGEDVVDYVEKLAYENDVDEIEVLAELEKEAFDVKRTAGNVFVGRKNLDNFAAKKNMYEGMKSQRGLGVTNDAFKASRKDFAKAGLGVAKRPAAIGAGLAAAGTGAYLLNKRRKRQAEKAAE